MPPVGGGGGLPYEELLPPYDEDEPPKDDIAAWRGVRLGEGCGVGFSCAQRKLQITPKHVTANMLKGRDTSRAPTKQATQRGHSSVTPAAMSCNIVRGASV